MDIPEPKEFAKKVVKNVKEVESLPTKRHFTDTTNAETIADMFGDEIRYDHKRNRWLIWKNHIWKPDNDGSINRYSITAARRQYRNAEDILDLQERTAASKWAIQSESKVRLDAALGITKSLEPIADAGDNWDLNTMILSCPNGIVDLTTGELRDGRPEDRITMTTSVEYDTTATCNRWEQFIAEVFEDDSEPVHYVHKALGYSITGSTREQVAFFCYGGGSNGKGVLFKTIRDILGDYAYDAPASLLQRNLAATNTNDVAATEFKRFLISSEILSATKINEQRLKGWTGGDKVTARYLYKENFSFEPTVKPWLFVNHKPQVEDDSYGFWRRVRLIPFNRKFEVGVDADLNLEEKLKAEYPGILNWLIKGCLLWQEEGLRPIPASVLSATRDYQVENDALAEFIFDACVENSALETKSSELFKAYNEWADKQSLGVKDKISLQSFGRRMGDKYQRVSTMKGKFYKGIGLKYDGYEDPASHDMTDMTPISENSSHENESKIVTKNDTVSVIQARNISDIRHQNEENEEFEAKPEEIWK